MHNKREAIPGDTSGLRFAEEVRRLAQYEFTPIIFITSLYGLKKTLPLADYNTEQVTLNYQMQIPIFFIDYTYPHSKYMLLPGETNEILTTALRCIADDDSLYNLIQTKGILNNILKAIKK